MHRPLEWVPTAGVGIVALVWGAGPGAAATLYVGANQPGAFASPQDALDVAENGDVIDVGPGRYPGRLDFLSKRVSVRGAGVGRTQLEPGCGFTSTTGVNFATTGRQIALEDLTLYADCSDPMSGPLTVRTPGSFIPGLRRVAILARGRLSVDLSLPPPVGIGSAPVEDLYIEQLSAECPSPVDVSLQLRGDVIRRAALFSRCATSVALPQSGDADVQVSNVLISTRAEEPLSLFSSMVVSHLTLAYSPAWNASAWASAVAFTEVAPMPSLHSSVLAGTAYPAVTVGCSDADGEWDLHWNCLGSAEVSPQSGDAVLVAECDPADPDCGPCPGPLPMEEADNITADPMFIHWTRDDNMSDDNFCPAPGSPLIDAGDPNELDPDGTRADIGAFGGPYAFSCEEVLDADGDGYRPITGDCDDTNADRWPFHDEVPCDGVDQDCDGADGTGCGDDDSAEDDTSDDDSGDDGGADDDIPDDDSADDDASLNSSDDDNAAAPEAAGCSCASACLSLPEGRAGAGLIVLTALFARRGRRATLPR